MSEAPSVPSTPATVRQVQPRDFDAIIALNRDALGSVGPLDRERLDLLVQHSHRALVAEVGGDIAGFVLTLGPGVPYESGRYQWFERRLDERYVYLDRVVVASAYRRQGLASRLYDAIEDGAPVALEIYDSNDVSLAFHLGRGYRQIGTLHQDGANNLMMLKLG